ncbi:MAG: 5-(carboxyamino)imidazole ribonucleotide mutase [Ardenticatenia bacterium]|nr:5-(carboxyamino)imidazole ribonucleotide mutase [Ardenticatenia bacterium]
MSEQLSPLVPILMGSKSDQEHGKAIARALATFGLASHLRVASAHKVPEYLLTLLREYEADPRPKVYITVAGRSNALSGLVDAQVSAPVIACPPLSSTFAGADIFSSLRMPSGVAPAVVLEPAAAALLAAKILGVAHADVRERVVAYQQSVAEKVIADDTTVSSARGIL